MEPPKSAEMAVPKAAEIEVTAIIVSFNTLELTSRAVETLLANAGNVTLQVIVWDNASHDGSADVIAARFPDVEVVHHDANLGFAVANNRASERALGEYVVLVNSDTETRPHAIENLLRFARAHPGAGIVGGRTLFADGRLNPGSCWNAMTPWSLLCGAIGLSAAFPGSPLFNPEGIGGWKRDTVREVDIVSGCFLMARTDLWRELGGFSSKLFMYGEDNDLCIRARRLGHRPMITPDAEIVHLGSASAVTREIKLVQLMRCKATIIRDHWSPPLQPLGLALLWLWTANRRLATMIKRKAGMPSPRADAFKGLWEKRQDWLAGY